MSVLATEERPEMARQRPPNRERIDLRADAEWIARVQRQADRHGLSLSAYIRRATTKELEQDEATEPPAEQSRPRRGQGGNRK